MRKVGRVYDDGVGYYVDIDALPSGAAIGYIAVVGGITYQCIGDGEWVVIDDSSDLPDVDFDTPVGAVPWLFLLLTAALFAAYKRRRC